MKKRIQTNNGDKGRTKMRESTRKRILYWHNRGMSIFYIQKVLKVKSWIAKEVIEAKLKIDYNQMFV